MAFPAKLEVHRFALLSVATAILLWSSCAHAPAAASESAALQRSVADRLYFGRSIPSGGVVSDSAWSAFLDDVVTPRFPAGLTAWPAQGRWRDASGRIVREDSFVIELIHPADARAEAAIGEIVSEYKRRFKQEAVLRVRDDVKVRF